MEGEEMDDDGEEMDEETYAMMLAH